MNAIELLELCEQYEVSIELADSEHIAVEPIDRLPHELINELMRHKLDIIDYLNQQRSSSTDNATGERIEPRIGTYPAANDAANIGALNPQQARALKGFYYLLNIKQASLTSKGYDIAQAAVKTDEYQTKLMQVIGIDYQAASDLQAELIGQGHIARHGSYLYIGDGTPKPITQCSGLPDRFLPRDASGRAFYDWFYEAEGVH